MTRIPDRLFVDKKDRDLYDNDSLKKELFAGRTRKEQFLFAMSIGFKNQVHRSLDTRENFFLVKDMHVEDEAMLDMVAIHHEEGSIDVLLSREKVFNIAQEYAHAGGYYDCPVPKRQRRVD